MKETEEAHGLDDEAVCCKDGRSGTPCYTSSALLWICQPRVTRE